MLRASLSLPHKPPPNSRCRGRWRRRPQGFKQSWLWHATFPFLPDSQLTPPLTAQTALTTLFDLAALPNLAPPTAVHTVTALTTLAALTNLAPLTAVNAVTAIAALDALAVLTSLNLLSAPELV